MLQAAIVGQCAATWFMTGLIWFVQAVHYPSYLRIGRGSFVGFQRAHLRSTGWVVGPAMAAEAAATILVAGASTAGGHVAGAVGSLVWIGLGLLALTWASTAFVQVLLHRILKRKFDAAAARRLVGTNRAPTVAWSARAALATAMLATLRAA